MRYQVLALDYDGTLATNGKVEEEVIGALERVNVSGRSLLLVTGRELDQLRGIFGHLQLFAGVVAENGALLYSPRTGSIQRLAEAPPPSFVETLRKRGVKPLSIGHVIVATWEPHQSAVLETIRESGLELEVIFNKGAVMILPSGINKATGLRAALAELGLAEDRTVGVGDAENDHSFLRSCALGIAVANAIPALKAEADAVTTRPRGQGVIEVIEKLLTEDLAGISRVPRTQEVRTPEGLVP
jgi:HAD superfamily hydrolase (TIGR01484 family)